MGLKGKRRKRLSVGKQRIKSDQNGIERLVLWRTRLWNVKRDKIRPKWDWKTNYRPHLLRPDAIDKIRPKWDWKFRFYIAYRMLESLIKSDQNGIERQLFYSLQRRWLTTDKIRPKWDWKREAEVRETGILQIKSDQNGIESIIYSMQQHQTQFDKIRPKWDWKGLDRILNLFLLFWWW